MEKNKIAFILSAGVAALAALASAGGLLLPQLYRDSEFFKAAWLSNDLVTLAVAVPLLLTALVLARRGSQRAALVWVGALAYMIYNYAFYLFGAAFNAFFLLYAALFTLSFYALVLALSIMDISGIGRQFSAGTPVKWIAVFLFFISMPLIFVEGGQCIRFIFTGRPPATPPLIFALDLTVVVPNTILAGVLLWQRRPWGFVLAAIMLVKALVYGLVLVTGTSLIAVRGIGPWDPLMPFYSTVAVGGLTGLFFLLKGFQPHSENLES